MKRALVIVVRSALGLSLLALLIWMVGPRAFTDRLQTVAPGYLALAFAAQGAAKIVWAMRWQEVLRVNGIARRTSELVSLLLIGLFFNNFLPTSMGGDVARGYLSAGGRDQLGTAYGVVVAERLMGFVALAALAVPALLWAGMGGADVPGPVLGLGLLTCAAILGGGGVIFLSRRWGVYLCTLFARWPRMARLVSTLVDAVQFMRRPGCRIARVVWLSVLVQVVGVLFFLFTARAVLIDASPVAFFFVVPMAIIASMIPISLNGLGLREGAFIGLLQIVGVAAPMAAAFAVLARLIDFVFALVGGLLFLVRPTARARLARSR